MSKTEEALAFLKKESGDGVSLYDHLTETLLELVIDKPANASEAFEAISAAVKEKKAKLAPEVATVSKERAKKAQLDWAAKSQALFTRPDEEPEGGVTVPDMMEEAGMWEWAGVSLGRLETYRLFLAIKKLGETLPADHQTIRFWGQISHRKGTYLIVEGRTLDETVAEIDESTMEGVGGVNRYTYWVTCATTGQPWVELPPVKQAQIVQARLIKRFFTGDLEAAVPGYPPFQGTEKNLLRAQIARITASTCVSPAGFFELDEDSETPAIKLAETEAIGERFPKPVEELNALDGWTHHEMEVNVLGRNTPMPLETDEEGNEIEPEDAPEQVEPVRSLADDDEGSWGFRVCPGGGGETSNSMVVAKSLVWPGAYGVAYGNHFTNVYVGDGVKFMPAPYQPSLPPAIMKEWAPEEEEEEEAGENPLTEAADLLIDPNPPEGEEEEED